MNEFDELFEQKMKMGFYQYVLIYAACALQFTNGSFQIILSIAAKRLQTDMFLTQKELTLLTSAYQWGILSGGFFVGILADRYGRYRVLTFNTFFGLSLFVANFFVESFWPIVILNWCFGVFSSSHYVVLVTYLFEHMPAKIRGRITVVFKSFTTIGRTLGSQFVSIFMIPYMFGKWKAANMSTAFVIITAFIPFLFALRESLRYSYSSHDYRSLYANFNWILHLNAKYGSKDAQRPEPVTSDDISVIKSNSLLRRSTLKAEGGFKLYLSRKYIYPNIALTLNRTLMQQCLTGFMVVFPQIFGTDKAALQLMTLVISGEYLGQIICGLVVDTKYFGRKRTMYLCNLATGIFFLLLGVGFKYLLIPVAFLTRMTAKCTLTAVEIYATEAYPVRIRTVAAGVNTLVVGVNLALFPFYFAFFRSLGESYIYLFLATNGFVAFLLAFFLAKDVER